MQIDWWTVALQVINFVVLVWLLWRFLFRPARAIIDRRRTLAEQALDAATAREQQAEAARQELERAKVTLAEESRELRNRLHAELEAERRNVLDAARKQADELLDNARASLVSEREVALTELKAQVAALATELAAELLRRIHPRPTDVAFLEGLERELQALPALERQRLQKDVDDHGAALTVATAMLLTPEQHKQWSARLCAALGYRIDTRFVTDPDLLGGAELRFPHAVLKLNWQDQLRQAQRLMEKSEHAA